MSVTVAQAETTDASAKRIEELGRIILAYSEITERLQVSHDQLNKTVQRLRGELSEKNRLLERKNRLAALGEMAAGMAHEIRNPLGGIQLYASLLSKDVEPMPASLELVKKISTGVKRLESIVSQVLQFSRDIVITPAPCDLAEIVWASIELAEHGRPTGGIKVEVTGPRPMNVTVDPQLIGQCVLNLAINALDAMNGSGGTLFVSYGAPPDGSDAKQFHLTLRDTGPGIEPKVLDRIFNPFFTTKDTGTGLGLSIVHRIVEAHDGTIIAANCEAGGAKFEIRI